MEQRRLGETGPMVSVVGLGCNNFGMRVDEAATAKVVSAALDAGITHFDTAEMYGGGKSEEFLGHALGARRDEVVIATKYLPRPNDEPYTPGVLRKRILDGCDISLGRLGTDRIDLYYMHYPDAHAPVDELRDALDTLRQAGKVLHVASSNVSAEQIDAEAAAGIGFCATQIEWNLLTRAVEADVVPAARRRGMGIVPYFPLASGLLTGKYRHGEEFPAGTRLASNAYFASVATDENFAKVERLKAWAEQRGHSVLELAVAWLAAQDGVGSVITGATKPEQIEANAAGAAWHLTPEEAAEVGNLAQG
ncbi:MAG TPA: aldo/keto reductase [Acidimicrobiales bacterium]|nr:aldo/keto reductase [Acidimicrobiales bacterium]